MAEFFSYSHDPAQNEAVSDFVSERIWGEPGRFGPHCTMGVFDDGELVAGVVYHNFMDGEGVIEVSAGADTSRWLTRPILKTFLTMPFEQLGCQAIMARHSEDRHDLRRMWRAVGATEYVIPRLRGKGAPAEVVSVLADDAWFASPHFSKGVH